MNPEVERLICRGVNKRTAYRMAKYGTTTYNRKMSNTSTKDVDFDYDAETPKGEWV